MKAYQADIAKFEANGTQVLGVSIDTPPSNKKFGEELGLTFPLLSDYLTRKTSKDYGVLNEATQYANRSTFVIDRDGIIQHIEQGGSAIDPSGAHTVCERIAKKK